MKISFGQVLRSMLVALVPFGVCAGSALAQSLTDVVFSPPVTVVMPPTAGTVYSGNLVYTFKSSGSLGGFVTHFLGVTNVATPLNGFTGTTVSIQVSRALTVADVSATGPNCPVSGIAAGANYTTAVLGYGAACTFVVTVPVVITKAAGTVGGAMNATTPRVPPAPATSCGLRTAGWAMWWVNSGCAANYSTNSVSLPYVSIGCTLSPTIYTVNLPTASAASLNAAGKFTTPPTALNIQFTGCGWPNTGIPSVTASATWSFSPIGPANNAIATGIANLGVQILDPSGNPVVNGSKTVLGTLLRTSPTMTSAHGVRYIAVGGAASVGSFANATATFNLSYD